MHVHRDGDDCRDTHPTHTTNRVSVFPQVSHNWLISLFIPSEPLSRQPRHKGAREYENLYQNDASLNSECLYAVVAALTVVSSLQGITGEGVCVSATLSSVVTHISMHV